MKLVKVSENELSKCKQLKVNKFGREFTLYMSTRKRNGGYNLVAVDGYSANLDLVDKQDFIDNLMKEIMANEATGV